MTLREVLHLAEERAAVMRALHMDKDRDDAVYQDLQDTDDDLSDKLGEAIEALPLVQRQQLMALYDPLHTISYDYDE